MRLLTPPTTEPVSLDEAKFAARLTGSTAFDAALPIYIQAAREIAEMETGVRWMAQEWRAEFTDWPAPGEVIRVSPATAVAVSYWSGSAWVNLAPEEFGWSDADPGVFIAPPVNESFPTLGDIASGPRVRVDVTAGADSAAAVPATIKSFIMGMVAYWVENPQAHTERPTMATAACHAMLDSQRVAY